MTTVEDAKRCPRCDQPGDQTVTTAGPKGSKLYTFVCNNRLCRWYSTGWIVQVNADGSIPERKGGEKEFTTPKDFDERSKKVEEMLRQQLRDETSGR